MSDCKQELISDVTGALVSKLDQDGLEAVSHEMVVALKDYQVTRNVTQLVKYDGANEMLLKRYKACLIIEGKSPKTIDAYTRIAKKLFQTLQRNYTDMTVSDLRYYLAYEKSRGVSNQTLENTRVMISAFFSWMLNEDLIIKNPCRTIGPIKCEQKVKNPFSSVEIDALRSACRTNKERAIVEVLLASGVRVSELCALKVTDVDFDTLAVTVREGKGSKQRITYINDLACKHLVQYLTSRNFNGDYLFYNKRKEPMNAGGIRHLLNVISERAGVTNVHPHRFRRTFATNFANRGMEIQEIGKLLGHTSLNTTLKYVYTSEAKIRASYQRYMA